MEDPNNAHLEPENKKSWLAGLKQSFIETIEVFIIAAVIVIPIRMFVFQPFIVSGPSMETTFHDGDYLIVDEISYRFSKPQRGDVVIFNAPPDPKTRYIKRIIALPGETIRIKEGDVFIEKDDQKMQLTESYLPKDLKTFTYNEKAIKLGPDQYFVMGDNRNNSKDSREWGPLPYNMIIGKVSIKVFSMPAAFQLNP